MGLHNDSFRMKCSAINFYNGSLYFSVGIATSGGTQDQADASLRLDKNGQLTLDSLTNNSRMWLQSTSGTSGSLYGYGNTIGFLDQNSSWAYQITTNGTHLWKTGNVEKFKIDSNGTATLTNSGGSSLMWFKHGSTVNGAIYGTGTAIGILDEGGNWAYRHNNDSAHIWYVGDVEKMMLNSSADIHSIRDVYMSGWARFTGTDGCYWAVHDTHVRGVDNSTIKVQMGSNTSSNIALQGSSGLNGYVASIPNYIGFKDLGGSWSYRIHNDGSQIWYDNGETARMELHTSGYLDATRFRSKENTNYYIDANDTSALYSLQVYSGLGMNSTDITAVKDIAFTSFASNLFGIMRANHNNSATEDSLSLNSRHDITFHLDTGAANSTSYFRIKANLTGSGASVFWVRDDGQVSCLGVTETSSMAYKKNITKIENPLNKIEKLRGIEFDYIDSNKHSIGMIAEEVNEIFPELVIKDDTGKVSAMSYTRMTAVLLEAVKELSQEVGDLRAYNDNNNK